MVKAGSVRRQTAINIAIRARAIFAPASAPARSGLAGNRRTRFPEPSAPSDRARPWSGQAGCWFRERPARSARNDEVGAGIAAARHRAVRLERLVHDLGADLGCKTTRADFLGRFGEIFGAIVEAEPALGRRDDLNRRQRDQRAVSNSSTPQVASEPATNGSSRYSSVRAARRTATMSWVELTKIRP